MGAEQKDQQAEEKETELQWRKGDVRSGGEEARMWQTRLLADLYLVQWDSKKAE